eukprot:485297_1
MSKRKLFNAANEETDQPAYKKQKMCPTELYSMNITEQGGERQMYAQSEEMKFDIATPANNNLSNSVAKALIPAQTVTTTKKQETSLLQTVVASQALVHHSSETEKNEESQADQKNKYTGVQLSTDCIEVRHARWAREEAESGTIWNEETFRMSINEMDNKT